MLFNSIDFAIFLPIVFICYWYIFNGNLKAQNFFLAFVSYIFYGWWDYRFLALIFLSSLIDFSIGKQINKSDSKPNKKLLLLTSLIVNLGILGYFKYANFFIENFTEAFSFFGHNLSVQSLQIILPVGISFYTFQTLSYTIDVYRKDIEAEHNFTSFLAYVSFFPQLVAGPIERATNLLPQFRKPRNFNYPIAVDGLKQMLWGFFKKLVIADNCAILANEIFNNYQDYNSLTLILGALFFTFQIYGDFSGYSDIAIGTARLFGFNLMQNFAFPYFSRDIAEFWRRWHISLSTWFRDYLYIPLGGSKGSNWYKVRNTFIIFLVSGFWHGANWTFIIWGLLNAIYFLPLLLTKRNRKNLNPISENRIFPSVKEFASIVGTFCLTVLAWIFFRAENLNHAISYILKTLTNSGSYFLQTIYLKQAFTTLLLIATFIVVEWIGRKDKYGIKFTEGIRSKKLRWGIYLLLISLTLLFMNTGEQAFIYFQF